MTARKHHYIPQCYLKGFAENPKKPKLYVVDKRNPRPFITSTEKIGAQRDFHSVNIEGLAPDVLEKQLSVFESEIGPALRRIEECQSLEDPVDKSLLLNLIGLIHIKNPKKREIFEEPIKTIGQCVIGILISDKRIFDKHFQRAKSNGFIDSEVDADYESMKNFVEEGDYDIEIARERQISLEFELFDKILPLLFKRKWHVIRAPEKSAGFITSDYPAVLNWQNPQQQFGPYSPGLGLPKTDLFFPVCKSLAFVGRFEEKEEIVFCADSDYMARFNGTIICNSQNQVYAQNENFIYMLADGKIKKGNTLVEHVQAYLKKKNIDG